MYVIRITLAVWIFTFVAWAQAPPQIPEQAAAAVAARLDQYQNVQGLVQTLSMLRRTAQVGEDVKAQADKLGTEAATYQRKGNNGEARRRLMHGLALLRGHPWNDKEEYLASLALRTDMTVADSSLPWTAQLVQICPAHYEAPNGLRLHVLLVKAPAVGTPNTTAALEGTKRDIGIYEIESRDLIDEPFRFDATLGDLADGSYRLKGEVLDGDTIVGTVGSIPIQLVRNFQSQREQIESNLSHIREHESTKTTIRYPFDLARLINLGRREIIRFDFAKEMHASAELANALQSGQDPLWRAKGDHKRHYWFAAAGEIMPYRVSVPTNWDGRSKLPVIMMLHGGGGDEDSYMDLNGGQLPKLAEQHGYIIVSPLGYRPLGAFGNPMRLPAVFGNPVREGRDVGDATRKRMLELSEKDVMTVLDLVASEYGADRSRIYLAGHSMGSGGTWHLGAKYADTWTALAPLSGPFIYEEYPFDKIKKMPILYTEGTGATPSLEGSRVLARYLKENGFNATYFEVDGTHGSMVGMVMPRVFEFFDQHPRKE